ncbi:hypothetical protein NLG97_g6924 [Lecanicillium saksenae]|uniref:Uncharacterized protein n=1 Tax=Lecanicillium saksenae TaxID=468837 RepID=A0ACC1QN99_9HYPO|nr:hypothetical protein NLG97_g6924 [Lecanicillium saksenae]
MGKFLQTLSSALDETIPGHDKAIVTLSPGSSAESGDGGLKLVATCQLTGFEPLQWPFHLKKSSPMAVANEFAIPLVETLHSKSRQVAMLIQALKHKDAVIAKLADKLEATGTGLEHVFTALSGRKKVTREAADDKIRGLAPFNERKMNEELQNNVDQPGDVTNLVNKVFGGNTNLWDTAAKFTSSNQDDWWLGFNSISSLPHRNAPVVENNIETSSAAAPSSPPNGNDVAMDDDDDEFQIQSTPPRLKGTKDNGALGDTSVSSKQVSPAKIIKEENPSSQEPKKAGRIGAIGGKKHAPPSSPPKAASPARPTTKAAVPDDDETASETASDVDETASLPEEAASPPPKAQSPSPAKAPVKKSGLGRIGGKPKPYAPDAETTEYEPTTAAGATEPKPTAPKRLGVIGKRIGGGTATQVDAAKDDVQRGRATSRNVSTEATDRKKETSQERADRKREELKKELEKKAAAGPAKKKRRF